MKRADHPPATVSTGHAPPSDRDLLETWLRRQLHEVYGVADEPIPEELLRLIKGTSRQ